MARVVIGDRALADAERLLDYLVRHDVADAGERIAEAFAALDIPEAHPRIGRPRGAGKRELVIGKRSRGHLALYRYDELDDLVIVLGLRAQREKGYASPEGDGRGEPLPQDRGAAGAAGPASSARPCGSGRRFAP